MEWHHIIHLCKKQHYMHRNIWAASLESIQKYKSEQIECVQHIVKTKENFTNTTHNKNISLSLVFKSH